MPISATYRESGFLSFDSVYKYFILIKMFKLIPITSNVLSIFLNDLLSTHFHETRFIFVSQYLLPFYEKSKCQTSFIYRGIKFLNALTSEILCIQSLNFKLTFKKQLMLIQWNLSFYSSIVLNSFKYASICVCVCVRVREKQIEQAPGGKVTNF